MDMFKIQPFVMKDTLKPFKASRRRGFHLFSFSESYQNKNRLHIALYILHLFTKQTLTRSYVSGHFQTIRNYNQEQPKNTLKLHNSLLKSYIATIRVYLKIYGLSAARFLVDFVLPMLNDHPK